MHGYKKQIDGLDAEKWYDDAANPVDEQVVAQQDNLSLATSERYKDNRGEWQERTEWHNLVGYQRVGEILRDYVQKGSRIFVEGELRTRSWEDRESGQRKFRTEVVVHEVSLLSQGAVANNGNGPEHHANGNGFVPQEFSAELEIEASEVPY